MYGLYFYVFGLAASLCALDDTAILYHSDIHDSSHQAGVYSKVMESACRYLAMRDVPELMARYGSGGKALDYGVGSGLSLKFLQSMGFQASGADISDEMIAEAARNCPDVSLYTVVESRIPCAENSFDCVFSSFVLFEIGSRTDLLAYLSEARRVMKKDGIFIAITGSEEVYSRDWYCLNVDYPENKNLVSGSLAKSYLPDVNMVFWDFFWKESDYVELFAQARLSIVAIHHPLGRANEQYPWKDERFYSPYVIFVARAE
jgi:ubiquinone/menaquinone biosynthesis C-methylase UbiE